MAKTSARDERPKKTQARAILESLWKVVVSAAEAAPDADYVDDIALRTAIESSVNHKQVGIRFCLPVQLLGKLTSPVLDVS